MPNKIQYTWRQLTSDFNAASSHGHTSHYPSLHSQQILAVSAGYKIKKHAQRKAPDELKRHTSGPSSAIWYQSRVRLVTFSDCSDGKQTARLILEPTTDKTDKYVGSTKET